MAKNFTEFLREWLDSPGSVVVPGQSTEMKVSSRNYTSTSPQMPEIVDAMFEASYFHDFLDKEGSSEEFNKFLKKSKRSGKEVTDYIKDSFKKKSSKKEK